MTLAVKAGREHALPACSRVAEYADLELAIATLPNRERRLIVMLPAHNEEAGIQLALESLAEQTRRPDLIVVVPDNCTDRTAEIARAHGLAVVAPSRDNKHKKAGALNQVLAIMLPMLRSDDAVMVMDADSALDPQFLESAMTKLGTRVGTGRHNPMIGGVGGTFRGGQGGGFVGMLQRNEYARYARDVRRLKGKVLVLTGTAAIFLVDVLRKVVEGRASGKLPGGAAQVYDTNVLTEDNELTLAIKHLGHRCTSPRECVVMTDVMPTWGELWRQRLRWKRGAMENLLQYGVTRVTLPYIAQHLVMFLGLAFFAAYAGLCAVTLARFGGVSMHWLWCLPALVFMLERAVTVRVNGWRNMLLAAALVPEWIYELFMQGCLLRAGGDVLRRSARHW